MLIQTYEKRGWVIIDTMKDAWGKNYLIFKNDQLKFILELEIRSQKQKTTFCGKTIHLNKYLKSGSTNNILFKINQIKRKEKIKNLLDSI